MGDWDSKGEAEAQKGDDTRDRELASYNKRMLRHLIPEMRTFLAEQSLLFIATSDALGECDCGFRSGAPGFICTPSPQVLMYPEYKGNGVMASVGNILENPNVGLNFIDFFTHRIGLHINGSAQVLGPARAQRLLSRVDVARHKGRVPELWVAVAVKEAYFHRPKHLPHHAPQEAANKIEDVSALPSRDFFGAKAAQADTPGDPKRYIEQRES